MTRFCFIQYTYYALNLRREGHCKMVTCVCLFIHLCVTFLYLVTQEREGLGNPKLAEWKHITRETREPI